MTVAQALCICAIGYFMIVAGVTWLWGPYGLIGGGAAAVAVLLFARVKE